MDTPISSTGPVTSHGPVTMESKDAAPPRQTAFAPSLTTEEDGLISLGQRTINLIWENTQMKIALSVIWAALIVSIGLAVFGKWLGTPDIQLAAVVFLFGVANLVTGFYFGRTNHQRQGGVGPKDGGR